MTLTTTMDIEEYGIFLSNLASHLNELVIYYRFRKAGYQAIDRICDYYYSLQERPVCAHVSSFRCPERNIRLKIDCPG